MTKHDEQGETGPKQYIHRFEKRKPREGAQAGSSAVATDTIALEDGMVKLVTEFNLNAPGGKKALEDRAKTAIATFSDKYDALYEAVAKAGDFIPEHHINSKREISQEIEKKITEACKRNGTTKKAFEKAYANIATVVNPEYQKPFAASVLHDAMKAGRGF